MFDFRMVGMGVLLTLAFGTSSWQVQAFAPQTLMDSVVNLEARAVACNWVLSAEETAQLDQVKALAAKNDHIKVEAIDARVKAAVSVQSGHIKEFGMAAQCGQEARDGFSSGLTLAATGAAKK